MAKVKIKTVTAVNHFGDHACPHCGVIFINPLNCKLQVGTTACNYCGKKYTVTKKIAEIANENKRKYDKACDRVIKELKSEEIRKN